MSNQEIIAISISGLLHNEGYVSDDMKIFVDQLHLNGYISDHEKNHVEAQMNFV